MNTKQFKTKLLRGYLSPPLFKLPVRKKQKMELPEDLKIHYRYVDFYNLLENEISKSHLIADLNLDQLSQCQSSVWKNPKCSVKIFYPAGYRSLEIEDLTPFSWHSFYLPSGSANMNFRSQEYYNGVLKKIGAFKGYSCWENSTCLSSGLEGYCFYENNLIGVLSSTQYFKGVSSYLDYMSYWYGDPNDTVTVPYGYHYLAWRYEDSFYIISNANVDLSQGGVKYNHTYYVGLNHISRGDGDSYNNPAEWTYHADKYLEDTYSSYFWFYYPEQSIYYDIFSANYLTRLCTSNNEQDIAGSISNIEKEGLL